jgi:hypothetical protein
MKRSLLLAGLAILLALVTLPTPARAFGDDGAFHPRIMLTGTSKWDGPRKTAPAQWSFELKRRTSAPARTSPGTVRADASSLLAEPFVVWTGDGPVAPLSPREIDGLAKFISTGGTLLVDDAAPETGEFGRGARRELARVLPDAVVMALPDTPVVFKSFYLESRPVGRVEGPAKLDAIVRGGSAQVIFSSHDLLGAAAKDPGGLPTLTVSPGGDTQREHAVRLLVNIAMYVLCSNYKDDQVHAPFLMRRRAAHPP